MGFLRRIAAILGFAREEAHEVKDEDDDPDDHRNRGDRQEPRRPTKGFSVQVPVAVERPHLGPVLTPCSLADGGVQGLRWYARCLRIDEDGDVADEFLDEVSPEFSSVVDDHRTLPRFGVKHNTRPAKVRNQAVTDGRIHQAVEFQGRLQWV
ncbi:PREDICTED: uncharacterized protein LOC104606468 [Nelumbo nucifera]|uniref:Uncharacterized protein LOC104606468 n=2 Tax=Nelumbo nucifera TaxID=4432 RepID=A0A1U8B208_NELNU|nr:PREDICTED: uncharacterized protein LOC104606468 [Nelumbo nucifera]DAD47516.1 TPA_asm: hypothetical protein HUJ06_017453 [Nelumbo nucifera]